MPVFTIKDLRPFAWILLGMVGITCRAQEIVLIQSTPHHDVEGGQIRELVDFYGLTLRVMDAKSVGKGRGSAGQAGRSAALAAFVSADDLESLDRRSLLRDLAGNDGKSLPILVYGVRPGTGGRVLQRWSEGNLTGCQGGVAERKAARIHVSTIQPFVGPLAGTDLPAILHPTCKLSGPTLTEQNQILTARSNEDSSALLVRTSDERGDIYFVPKMQVTDQAWVGQPWGLSQAFSQYAPYLMFLQYAAHDYAWHLNGRYANFTIDDPWLSEPYGNLDYQALLEQMKLHHFHTTIAFIPWNFDRSDPQVVLIFQRNPEYFSISLHGNNHAHREFDSYSRSSLDKQVSDIRQGVARMEEFRRLTGIPYDRFMIFPHGVAPEATFAALRVNGFLGTANSLNVPLGIPFPKDPLFLLRPQSNRFSGFLSLSRYSVEAPLSSLDMAIQSYMGNPILLYAHEAFFQGGSGVFNSTAELINGMNPGTRWTSLGNIARNMYELRRRQDGDLDVRMESSEITLTNPSAREQVFHVQVEAPDSANSSGVSLQGVDGNVQSDGQWLTARVVLSAGATRNLRISYGQDFQPAGGPIAKSSLYVWGLRYISDFRDMYLSRHAWGRALVGSYYVHHADSIESHFEKLWLAVVLLLVTMMAALGYSWKRRKRPHRMATSSAKKQSYV